MSTVRDRLADAADRLWVRFASVVLAAQLQRTAVGEYNPVSGDTGDVPANIPATVILESWRQDQIDGDVVKAGDRIAKVRQREIGVEPSTDDFLLIEKTNGAGLVGDNAQLWAVLRYTSDPAGIVFDVHVRARQ